LIALVQALIWMRMPLARRTLACREPMTLRVIAVTRYASHDGWKRARSGCCGGRKRPYSATSRTPDAKPFALIGSFAKLHLKGSIITMEISNLNNHPRFADTVADRGWHAWWTESGVPLAQYRAHLDPMIKEEGIPFGLIAHEGDVYLGSVLVIENDLDARPQYTPWIAALWVEPERRRQGIAAKLIATARTEASRYGQLSCYLCATPDKSPYYLAQGFKQIEDDVSELSVFVI
jgi:GNAT superfamily N-acetyltransferase